MTAEQRQEAGRKGGKARARNARRRAQAQARETLGRSVYWNTDGAPTLRVVMVKKDRAGRTWFSFVE